MIDKIISNNINKLTVQIINDFLINNDIKLNDNELTFIYNYILDNWKILLHNDPDLSIVKNNIRDTKYNELMKLYFEYKERYKDYL